jgi:hypothetical protein
MMDIDVKDDKFVHKGLLAVFLSFKESQDMSRSMIHRLWQAMQMAKMSFSF